MRGQGTGADGTSVRREVRGTVLRAQGTGAEGTELGETMLTRQEICSEGRGAEGTEDRS